MEVRELSGNCPVKKQTPKGFEDALKSVVLKTANFKVARYVHDVRKELFVLSEWIEYG